MPPKTLLRSGLTAVVVFLLAPPGVLGAPALIGPDTAPAAEPRLTAFASVDVRNVGAPDFQTWSWEADSTHTGILVKGFLTVFAPEGSTGKSCDDTTMCRNAHRGRSPRGTCVDAEALSIDLLGESPRVRDRACG